MRLEYRFVLIVTGVLVVNNVAGVYVGTTVSPDYSLWMLMAPIPAIMVMFVWYMIKAVGLPPWTDPNIWSKLTENRHLRRALCLWLVGLVTMPVAFGLQLLASMLSLAR